MERALLGSSHDEIGASLLRRWGVGEPIVEAVAYHDEPFRSSEAGFRSVTAVYAANVLDGGGYSQDGDGSPSEQTLDYLAEQGLSGCWPKWQKWVEQMRKERWGCFSET